MPGKYVIGFDLGGTHMAAGLVDASLNIVTSLEAKTPTGGQEELLDGILTLVRDLAAKAPEPVAAVGFGIPSMIDQKHGRAIMSVNIPLADFDFVDFMRAETGLPVFIDNDANVAALAEVRAGAARGARQALMITMGTGIGGGIIIDGEVYRGATGSAAELGHIVIDVNGPHCQGACDNYGCFEVMASGTALARYAAEASAAKPASALGRAAAAGEILDGALVWSLAREGDSDALAIFEKIGFYTGVGITSLVNIFNPEYFVVGGGLIQAGELILEPARRVLMSRGLRPNRDIVKVVPARFGPDAGMIGAACLAQDGLRTKM
ncbi:MAG: ROK family protein [Actinobacteria bacterium]|nr:ROK family protein [Actinomycetota bacterium]MCL5882643.1 ROK family protein [Actinomycetota bacterium]